MRRFAWGIFGCLSMVSIGTNMLAYSHNPAEILQFLGGWLIASGLGIAAGGFIIAYLEGKNGHHRQG